MGNYGIFLILGNAGCLSSTVQESFRGTPGFKYMVVIDSTKYYATIVITIQIEYPINTRSLNPNLRARLLELLGSGPKEFRLTPVRKVAGP